jgi:hypothetical protein
MPTLQVRVTDEEMERLRSAAEERGRTLSDHARILLFGWPTAKPTTETAAERAHRVHRILERAAHAKPRPAGK